MPYIKTVKVLFESSDGVLTISTTEKQLYVTAVIVNDGSSMATKVYPIKSRWESACKPTELLHYVELLLGSKYTQELQDRHEEFLDDLISYWED